MSNNTIIIINDDEIPDLYPYSWSPNSSISVEEYTKKYKPSMVQNNDGTKPVESLLKSSRPHGSYTHVLQWLWVRNSKSSRSEVNIDGALEEARGLLTEATERVAGINEDNSIPVRASKKAGTKSKKQVRDEVLADYTQKLKDVHIKYGYKTGKWLIFVPPDAVDGVWSRLAISVAQGSLSQTVVDVAKVATTPPNESFGQRVICVYMSDVFDKEKVLEVMRILLQNHGVNLSGVKSDLYTKIGLDSKHPSHLQSTIWKNTDFLKDDEIKELRGKYFAKLKEDQAAKIMNTDTKESDKQQTAKPKMTVDDDPFGSESEGEQPVSKNTLKRSAEEDKKPAKKAKTSLRK